MISEQSSSSSFGLRNSERSLKKNLLSHRSGSRPQETGHYTSNMDVDTHLDDKKVCTNALLKNKVEKEEITETNTKVIERIKSDSHKILVCAKIWRRRILSEFNVHHVYTTFSKEELFAHLISISDPTRKWVPYFRASVKNCKGLQTQSKLMTDTSPRSRSHTSRYEKDWNNIYMDSG